MLPRFIILGLAVVIATTGAAQAQASPGNMNCDGTVDGLDVAPFVLALIDPSGYGAAYPACELSNADLDCDGTADTDDVVGFVDCLLTGNCPPCPTGSCCQPDGTCTVTLAPACLSPGVWTMFAVCDPNPCSTPVVIETVTVGNPGNPGDTRYPSGGISSFGGVGYVYNIGKYEVTAGQYCEFLNKVAATDTYNLYNTSMWSDSFGCKIQRSGSSSSYMYSVAADWANRPVNFVSWGDAARFCNWLHNGQPTGEQGLTTTEDGSYYLNGAMDVAALQAVVREPDATWMFPSEDEWYKAAYHKNDGVTGIYFDYPTSSDSGPSNDLIDPDPGNNANFRDSGDYTIGSPYYRTEVGEFENSDSPYGTFDQGGNVAEWNEAVIDGSYRGVRGGWFGWVHDSLLASTRISSGSPTSESSGTGFRVSGSCGGACCQTDGSCAVTLQAGCTGTWQGAGTDCNPNPCSSPPVMALIPAGEFLMGDSFGEGYPDELPRHAVSVDAFYMDTYEVTNQQYAEGLNWANNQGNLISVTDGVVYQYNTGTSPAYCIDPSVSYCTTTSAPPGEPFNGQYSQITWNGTTFGVTSGKESYSMVMVSWYGSVAYANWRSGMEGKPLCYDLSTWTCNFGSGYRLPTEAEWEKAARGGVAGHRFPWADTDTIQHARANYYSSSSYSYDTSSTRGYHPLWVVVDYPPLTPARSASSRGRCSTRRIGAGPAR